MNKQIQVRTQTTERWLPEGEEVAKGVTCMVLGGDQTVGDEQHRQMSLYDADITQRCQHLKLAVLFTKVTPIH